MKEEASMDFVKNEYIYTFGLDFIEKKEVKTSRCSNVRSFGTKNLLMLPPRNSKRKKSKSHLFSSH